LLVVLHPCNKGENRVPTRSRVYSQIQLNQRTDERFAAHPFNLNSTSDRASQARWTPSDSTNLVAERPLAPVGCYCRSSGNYDALGTINNNDTFLNVKKATTTCQRDFAFCVNFAREIPQERPEIPVRDRSRHVNRMISVPLVWDFVILFTNYRCLMDADSQNQEQ